MVAPIVLTGDAAPGTAAGVTFAEFGVPAINELGQVAFLGTLAGPGVDDTNFLGAWLASADGGVELIARVGDLFDVDDSPATMDLRQIVELNFVFGNTGSHDGRPEALNDLGQFAFKLRFEGDTEGIFIAGPGASVPEPMTLSIASFACAAFVVFRRSHRYRE